MDTFVVRRYIYILKYQVSVNKQARYVITLEGRYLRTFEGTPKVFKKILQRSNQSSV